jgi:hypothetical protein
LEQKRVLEQHSITFGAKACFAPSLLEQKFALEQHSITFAPKACFGATLHHFWSKSMFGSNTPSLLVQKACFGATLNRFSNKKR